MTYTEEQRCAFKKEYEIRRRRHLLLFVTFGLISLGFVLLSRMELPFDRKLLILVAFFLLSLIGILDRKIWRCPACEKPLWRRGTGEYCQHCGVPLAG